jgi:hypothetical protein
MFLPTTRASRIVFPVDVIGNIYAAVPAGVISEISRSSASVFGFRGVCSARRPPCFFGVWGKTRGPFLEKARDSYRYVMRALRPSLNLYPIVSRSL